MRVMNNSTDKSVKAEKRSHTSSSDASQTKKDFPALVASLYRAIDTTQEKFVALGNDRQSLYKKSESFLQGIMSSVERLHDAETDRLLKEINAAVRHSVASLRSIHENNIALLGHIDDTVSVVKQRSS